jgi:CheY-like chemotaxis protein
VTRKFGGTGLGLAISRQLVELMRGSMALASQPGRGSRFSFVIPAGVPRMDTAPPTPAADLGVLLIGTDSVIGGAIRDALAAESAQVIGVDSPLDAIEALRKFGAGIARIRVILDCHPTTRIEQAVSGLRAAAGPRPLEILTLVPPDADAAPLRGVTRSLVKPVCTADLLTPATAADAAQSMMVRILPSSGSRGRALVVEDNAVNQEMARAMLDMLGFEVLTAANGQEGVDAAAANPDLVLILMDCQMPVMDGLAAARAIRAAEPAERHVPIVALTGNAMPGDREACVAAGMDDYLAKPFSLNALRTTIDRWAGPASADATRATARR